jgi:hypothetical protein
MDAQVLVLTEGTVLGGGAFSRVSIVHVSPAPPALRWPPPH